MGAWVRNKKRPGIWGMFGPSVWTFSPWLDGSEDPNMPPPELQGIAKRGDPIATPDGNTYRTWMIPPPDDYSAPLDKWQRIEDRREKLNITHGDPYAIELTPGQ